MRKSSVEVQPLDLTKVRVDTIQIANHIGEFRINQARSEDWGIVQTADGTYGLSRDGAGNKRPITIEDPLLIDVWTERVVNDDIGRPVTFGTLSPQWHVALNEQQALMLQVGEKENLSTFIANSDPEHQKNFEDWNTFISHKFHWDLGDLLIDNVQVKTDSKRNQK